VFVDYNQNAPHKTVFGVWSARARPGAQVSAPLAWDEINTIHPDELTIASVPARLAAAGDPWVGMDEQPQSLEPLLELHERGPAAGAHGRQSSGRPAGRSGAAGLSEAAGRAAAGGAEPGSEGRAVDRCGASATAPATTAPNESARTIPRGPSGRGSAKTVVAA